MNARKKTYFCMHKTSTFIMKKNISGLLSFFIALAALTALMACGEKKFHVTGHVGQAKDSVLYFENMALDGIHVLDSVKLDEKGSFDFEGRVPEAPDFFRLRIAGQVINLSVDSTETIRVSADYPTMSTRYKIEGSKNCEMIKMLAIKQTELQKQVNDIIDNPTLGIRATEDSIAGIVEAYKRHIVREFVYKEPMKAYAYFALFQNIMIGNDTRMIFNPQRFAKDVKAFAAVATSWDTFFPGSLRGQNLHNITIEGIKDKRIEETRRQELTVSADKVGMANLIDVSLVDNRGDTRTLSQLEGKVVLFDFHVFASKDSHKRIMLLRELYNKYHYRGLEIYQVSLDNDEHFWKTQTEALPWISVRDDGTRTQAYLSAAPGVPCSFIIDRNNEVVMGPRQITNLDADIARYLK